MSQLKPCPFCGHPPEERQRKYNPYTRCLTPGCMAGRLPLISVDLPEDIERWNCRTLPEGIALVPKAITAESGHKAGMIGDFHETIVLECSPCDGEGCEECHGTGQHRRHIPVSWTTIKAIHRRIVEIAGEAPTDTTNAELQRLREDNAELRRQLVSMRCP